MDIFIQQVVSGLATGGIYASLALSLVMIYQATDVVNFAQGEMAMFSTYLAWSMLNRGAPYWVAFVLTVTIAFVGGLAFERLIIRPVEQAPVLAIVMLTLGPLVIFNSVAGWLYSYIIQPFPSPFPRAPIRIGRVVFGPHDLGVIGVTLVMLVLLWLFFRFTSLGLALRAAAQNPAGSRLVGIRVGWMLALGWGLAPLIGAVAGMMVAPIIFLEPNMMSGILIYAFASATLPEVSSAEEHACRVEIGVGLVPAGHAAEPIALAAGGVHDAARRTGLAGVRGRHLYQPAARCLQLVAEHHAERRPPGPGEVAAEPAAQHPGHVEPLDDHHAVALGVAGRENVQDVGALAADRAVQLGDAEPGLRPALRALRSACEDTLRVGQSAQAGVQMLRVRDQAAVGIAQQVRHAAVDRHDRPGSPRRLWHLLLTLDRHEPLIHLAGERVALRFPHEGSVQDRPDRAELREGHAARSDPKDARMRLGDGHRVPPLLLPPGPAGQPLEVPLPRGIELHEHLRADVTGHLGQPRDLSPQLGQLVDLVEG